LRAGIEDCAAQGLGAGGEDGRDDEQTDSEEGVGADLQEDLGGSMSAKCHTFSTAYDR
jgi:hypothetical protein